MWDHSSTAADTGEGRPCSIRPHHECLRTRCAPAVKPHHFVVTQLLLLPVHPVVLGFWPHGKWELLPTPFPVCGQRINASGTWALLGGVQAARRWETFTLFNPFLLTSSCPQLGLEPYNCVHFFFSLQSPRISQFSMILMSLIQPLTTHPHLTWWLL